MSMSSKKILLCVVVGICSFALGVIDAMLEEKFGHKILK